MIKYIMHIILIKMLKQNIVETNCKDFFFDVRDFEYPFVIVFKLLHMFI